MGRDSEISGGAPKSRVVQVQMLPNSWRRVFLQSKESEAFMSMTRGDRARHWTCLLHIAACAFTHSDICSVVKHVWTGLKFWECESSMHPNGKSRRGVTRDDTETLNRNTDVHPDRGSGCCSGPKSRGERVEGT